MAVKLMICFQASRLHCKATWPTWTHMNYPLDSSRKLVSKSRRLSQSCCYRQEGGSGPLHRRRQAIRQSGGEEGQHLTLNGITIKLLECTLNKYLYSLTALNNKVRKLTHFMSLRLQFFFCFEIIFLLANANAFVHFDTFCHEIILSHNSRL